jgi:hypothetical protein
MKIKLNISLLLVIISLTLPSCTDEDIVGNWVKDGSELEEGSEVYFLMYQNYPNPFNPSTSIKYQVAKPIYLELTIWSDDWVKQETLVNRFVQAGIYEVKFNASGYSSGEYFYTMTGEGMTQVMKLKIVK